MCDFICLNKKTKCIIIKKKARTQIQKFKFASICVIFRSICMFDFNKEKKKKMFE